MRPTIAAVRTAAALALTIALTFAAQAQADQTSAAHDVKATEIAMIGALLANRPALAYSYAAPEIRAKLVVGLAEIRVHAKALGLTMADVFRAELPYNWRQRVQGLTVHFTSRSRAWVPMLLTPNDPARFERVNGRWYSDGGF
jgi:hypothetical protein